MAIWRRENIHQHVNGTAPRSEPIVSGVTVSMADSTGTTLTEISFSGVTGSPSPSITEFEITDGNFSQQFILNILGLITKE